MTFTIRQNREGHARTRAEWFPIMLPALDRTQITARYADWVRKRDSKERTLNGFATDGRLDIWRNPLREGNLFHDDYVSSQDQSRLVHALADVLGGTVMSCKPMPALCIPFFHGQFARRPENDAVATVAELIAVDRDNMRTGRICFSQRSGDSWTATHVGGIMITIPRNTTVHGGIMLADMLHPLGELTVFGTFLHGEAHETVVLTRNGTLPKAAATAEGQHAFTL